MRVNQGMLVLAGAALAVAMGTTVTATRDGTSRTDAKWPGESRRVPNDFGPVIDTTPESKRARRRRAARLRR